VSTLTVPRPKVAASPALERARGWLSPLNLHWAGVGLLALANLYLLAHMAFLWQRSSSHNADALSQQRIALKTAEISALPLRGLDAKLERATTEADGFYKRRLPGSYSEVAGELGRLTNAQKVRLIRVGYSQNPVLAGSADELTEVHMDCSLSGDYRPLVQFINSLERDKMFFAINGVTLTGQQSGTVNLRLRLTSYLRGRVEEPAGASAEASGDSDAGPPVPTGGPGR